jgi:hypothetical protein
VRQELSNRTGPSLLAEMFWNFFHYRGEKRLKLAQNPQFYEALPSLPSHYGGDFKRQPIERYEGTVHVLTNNTHGVLLECAQESRVFDNVWAINDILIVRDIFGNLQGKTIVGNSLQATKLLCYYLLGFSQSDPDALKRIDEWKKQFENCAAILSMTPIPCINQR